MAKTIEEIITLQLGALTMSCAKLETENGRLRDRVAELETAVATATAAAAAKGAGTGATS